MAKTLLDLAARMKRLATAVDKAASDHAVKVALTIVGDLAYHTPVDTSKALSNWVVSIGNPTFKRIDPYFFGEGGSSQNASAQQTIAAAKAILANKKPGQVIWITNSQPYIRRLNDGYSRQAPAGFVQRSVLIGRRVKFEFKAKA